MPLHCPKRRKEKKRNIKSRKIDKRKIKMLVSRHIMTLISSRCKWIGIRPAIASTPHDGNV